MTRLLVLVEGVTEAAFVEHVLKEYLYGCGFTGVNASLLGHARLRAHRGGAHTWESARKDILNHLKGDPGCLVTTMVDYYGLPRSGAHAWPGRAQAGRLPLPEKAPTVEEALLADIAGELGDGFDRRRFTPFVVMHEFEALLFSDSARFGHGIGRPDLIPAFQAIRDHFESPEAINDAPATAPSKRVEALYRGYNKPLHGRLAAQAIGLQTIRAACPHFNDWIARLESRLGTPRGG